MKAKLVFGMLFVAVSPSYSQTEINEVAEVKSLQFNEWNTKYNTTTAKGDILIAISINEVSVNTKRCLPEPIEFKLPVDGSAPYKNLGWYVWDQQANCWVKSDPPIFKRQGTKGSGVYISKVTCPGTYGFFTTTSKNDKGVVISCPRGFNIKSFSIQQAAPAFAINKVLKEPSRTCQFFVKDLQFAGTIEMVVINKDGVAFNLNQPLIGNYTDLSKPIHKNKFQYLVIRNKDLIEQKIVSVN